ncbi:MAG: DNA adenine methylase [Verrucomicrobia bacterium]|nr:DNA adenine methylase [Verrucomicrobiota bacterium]
MTFKANLSLGRHGWLRLTPAYSRHLVEELVAPLGKRDRVLDPFCGTGTTALTCAEHGMRADTVDINPFLVWLANAKFAAYTPAQLEEAKVFAASVRLAGTNGDFWHPPLHDIEKWWHAQDLHALSALFNAIKHARVSEPARNLLLSAFCRVAIETAAVSFGHQSMSFKPRNGEQGMVDLHSPANLKGHFTRRLHEVLEAAQTPLDGTLARARLGDSRHLHGVLTSKYKCVITSPPYPNRISYIRELRPYMYWLGYLTDGRQAGDLDWQAIGGTWGCATSNLTRWQPDPTITALLSSVSLSASDGERAGVRCGFLDTIAGIAARSQILSHYVHKYFEDCVWHIRSLARVLAKGAAVHYIVGNSKFYDVMVPTELLYAGLLRQHGFADVTVENIRKRNSKKELFEFVVSGRFGG